MSNKTLSRPIFIVQDDNVNCNHVDNQFGRIYADAEMEIIVYRL
jgi:hypothetical protein